MAPLAILILKHGLLFEKVTVNHITFIETIFFKGLILALIF